MAPRANSTPRFMSVNPGRMMISMPMMPAVSANQRRRYMISPRISTAAREARIGLEYMIAITSAIGIKETAANTQ